jgi:hypothetical protein
VPFSILNDVFSVYGTARFKCLLDSSKIERIVESNNDHIAHAEIYLTVNGIYVR